MKKNIKITKNNEQIIKITKNNEKIIKIIRINIGKIYKMNKINFTI